MTTKLEAFQAGFKIDTYESRRDLAKANAELAAAVTIQKMIDRGFTAEEIQTVFDL